MADDKKPVDVNINIPKKDVKNFWQKNKLFVILGAVAVVVVVALLSFLT